MAEFRSAEEFREVMDKVFTIMSTDPEMGPKLRDARVPQRFEFPDQDAVVNITYDDSGGEQNLQWKWSDAVDWDPQVEMTMDSDVANKYFQGKENVPMALARRRIKSSGDIKAALKLIPITKPVFEQFRALVEREYPHLARLTRALGAGSSRPAGPFGQPVGKSPETLGRTLQRLRDRERGLWTVVSSCIRAERLRSCR